MSYLIQTLLMINIQILRTLTFKYLKCLVHVYSNIMPMHWFCTIKYLRVDVSDVRCRLYWYGSTLTQVWIDNHMPSKCGMRLLIHSHTSTVARLIVSYFIPQYTIDAIIVILKHNILWECLLDPSFSIYISKHGGTVMKNGFRLLIHWCRVIYASVK